MARPAARVNDICLCTQHGSSVAGPGSTNVRINQQYAHRAGDVRTCTGGIPDKAFQGAATVTVNGRPAVRMSDQTLHQGVLTTGSSNVVIGGPTIVGDLAAAMATCIDAALGRVNWDGLSPQDRATFESLVRNGPNFRAQKEQNCALEAMRQIIGRQNPPAPSEQEMLDWAIAAGYASDEREPDDEYGSANQAILTTILREKGVDAYTEKSTVSNLAHAVGQGKGVILSVAPKEWNPNMQVSSKLNHAVLVVAMECDAEGNPTAFYVNDSGTGTGSCVQRVPAVHVASSLVSAQSLVITSAPMWK